MASIVIGVPFTSTIQISSMASWFVVIRPRLPSQRSSGEPSHCWACSNEMSLVSWNDLAGWPPMVTSVTGPAVKPFMVVSRATSGSTETSDGDAAGGDERRIGVAWIGEHLVHASDGQRRREALGLAPVERDAACCCGLERPRGRERRW